MKLKRYLAAVPAAFPWLQNLAGLLAAGASHRWMSTLEYKGAFYDPTVDPAHPENNGQKLYIFWHEYLTFPIYLRGNCNLTMMLSQHRDADVLARAAQHLGFGHFRGSTTRGGAQALLQRAQLGRPEGDHHRLPVGHSLLDERGDAVQECLGTCVEDGFVSEGVGREHPH